MRQRAHSRHSRENERLDAPHARRIAQTHVTAHPLVSKKKRSVRIHFAYLLNQTLTLHGESVADVLYLLSPFLFLFFSLEKTLSFA